MGNCASSNNKQTSQPRIMATFPGDPDHGSTCCCHHGCEKAYRHAFTLLEVVVDSNEKEIKVPKPRVFGKHTRCFLDIAIDGKPIGRIIIKLRPDVNPRTCENFRALCTGEHGYSYKDCKFHRIVPGFVLQTGDVELKTKRKEGRGGMSIYGRSFADENLDDLSHDQYGVVSMANSGPHTNNSQFMVIIDREGTTWLDGKHAVFGQVEEESFEVLQAIENCAELFDRDEQQRARITKTATIVDCGQL